jgi:hypothetical protein
MHLIPELERTRDETLRYFSLAGPGLERSYEPGKWPVRQTGASAFASAGLTDRLRLLDRGEALTLRFP